MGSLLILRGAMGAGKSAVARKLQELCSGLRVMEIDDLKVKKYGTATKCDPSKDFPEAGHCARAELERGSNVAVVEPLCEFSHLKSLLDATGHTEDSPDVHIVWLDCSLSTALTRKGNEFSQHQINTQHRRYKNRYRPRREVIISTDEQSVDDVAGQIANIAFSTVASSH